MHLLGQFVHGDLVAAGVFGDVEALVGDAVEGVGIEILVKPRRGDADRHRAAEQVILLAQREGFLGHRRADALGHPERAGGRGFRQDDAELFAAGARAEVGLAQAGGDDAGDALQHLVADLVAVIVVDVLEVIHVDQQYRQIAVAAADALQLVLQPGEKDEPRGQPGQHVGVGHARHLLARAQFGLDPVGDIAETPDRSDDGSLFVKPGIGHVGYPDFLTVLGAHEVIGLPLVDIATLAGAFQFLEGFHGLQRVADDARLQDHGADVRFQHLLLRVTEEADDRRADIVVFHRVIAQTVDGVGGIGGQQGDLVAQLVDAGIRLLRPAQGIGNGG